MFSLSAADRHKRMLYCSSSAVASLSLLSMFFSRKENWYLTVKIQCVFSVNTHSATEKGNTRFLSIFPEVRELLPAHQFSAAAAWSCSPSQCEASCSVLQTGPLSSVSLAPSWPSCAGNSIASKQLPSRSYGSALEPASLLHVSE